MSIGSNSIIGGIVITVVGGVITAWLADYLPREAVSPPAPVVSGPPPAQAEPTQTVSSLTGQPRPASPSAAIDEGAGVLPAGIYAGTYRCLQGWTRVRLEMFPPNGGVQQGRYRFGGDDLPEGSYVFAVRRDASDQLLLQPLYWENQPAGYHMVAARVRVSGASLVGRVDDPQCGEFSAARVAG